jgi:hypothetical protein
LEEIRTDYLIIGLPHYSNESERVLGIDITYPTHFTIHITDIFSYVFCSTVILNEDNIIKIVAIRFLGDVNEWSLTFGGALHRSVPYTLQSVQKKEPDTSVRPFLLG